MKRAVAAVEAAVIEEQGAQASKGEAVGDSEKDAKEAKDEVKEETRGRGESRAVSAAPRNNRRPAATATLSLSPPFLARPRARSAPAARGATRAARRGRRGDSRAVLC